MLLLYFSIVFDITDPLAQVFSLSLFSFYDIFATTNTYEASVLCQIFSYESPFSFRRCRKLKPKGWRVEKHFKFYCASLITCEEFLPLREEMTGCKLPHATKV